MQSILKPLTVSRQHLATLLGLPEGVEIAGVNSLQFGIIVFTIADPANALPVPTDADLVNVDGKWVPAPTKGDIKGV